MALVLKVRWFFIYEEQPPNGTSERPAGKAFGELKCCGNSASIVVRAWQPDGCVIVSADHDNFAWLRGSRKFRGDIRERLPSHIVGLADRFVSTPLQFCLDVFNCLVQVGVTSGAPALD